MKSRITPVLFDTENREYLEYLKFMEYGTSFRKILNAMVKSAADNDAEWKNHKLILNKIKNGKQDSAGADASEA